MNLSARVSRGLLSLGLAFFSALVVVLATSAADAASLKINKAGIVRKVPLRSDPVTRFWVNRSECQSDDVMSFPLSLVDYGGSQLEVWVGEGTGDCTAREARSSVSATCWCVYRATPTTNIPTIDLRVQDIAAKKKPPLYDLSIGTKDDCTSTTTSATSVTLYFMLISSLDNQGGDSWATSLDLLGPNPPTGFAVGGGGTLLKATWNQNNDTDVSSYGFFCDPPPGYAPDADTTYGPGPRVEAGTGTTTSTCPDASAGTSMDDAEAPDAEAPDDVSDGAICTADGSGGSGGSGGTTTACGLTALAPDIVPDPDFITKYRCGTSASKGATSSVITGLTNWQPTNVAISAVDAAGNAGPLSDIACGVPEPVNGFDEVYRQSGGNAGDAYCAVRYPGGQRAASLMSSGLLALAALFVRRRRAKAPRA